MANPKKKKSPFLNMDMYTNQGDYTSEFGVQMPSLTMAPTMQQDYLNIPNVQNNTEFLEQFGRDNSLADAPLADLNADVTTGTASSAGVPTGSTGQMQREMNGWRNLPKGSVSGGNMGYLAGQQEILNNLIAQDSSADKPKMLSVDDVLGSNTRAAMNYYESKGMYMTPALYLSQNVEQYKKNWAKMSPEQKKAAGSKLGDVTVKETVNQEKKAAEAAANPANAFPNVGPVAPEQTAAGDSLYQLPPYLGGLAGISPSIPEYFGMAGKNMMENQEVQGQFKPIVTTPKPSKTKKEAEKGDYVDITTLSPEELNTKFNMRKVERNWLQKMFGIGKDLDENPRYEYTPLMDAPNAGGWVAPAKYLPILGLGKGAKAAQKTIGPYTPNWQFARPRYTPPRVPLRLNPGQTAAKATGQAAKKGPKKLGGKKKGKLRKKMYGGEVGNYMDMQNIQPFK